MKPKSPASTPPINWETDPLDWSRTSGQTDRLLAALDVRKKRQHRRRFIAAGSAAALFVVGFVLFSNPSRPVTDPVIVPSGKALVTVPERRILPDGSTVEIKPGSEIVVKFSAASPGYREVELIKGEGLFNITKNPDRPFIVTAGGIRFRAVGTAFSVELRVNAVEMLVTEGTVAVEPAQGGNTSSESIATVDAGHRVKVDFGHTAPLAVVPSSISETAEKLAWRVPRLEFNETPLWEVVSMLNQHSGARISLANADLGRVEISGALRADNIEPLLQILEANYRIKVVRRAGGDIELRQAP